MNKYRRAIKPDAQAFDEVRFITVPRYKTSDMSGDEWRISITMQFYRKGNLVHEEAASGKMESAMSFAGFKYARACDDGHAFYAGEGDYCDQEGCANKATVTYRLKKEWCSRCGSDKEAIGILGQEGTIRRFCEEHKRRGDCGLEDADINYELIDEDSPISG